MLIDANILLYAVDESSPFFARSSAWLVQSLNGTRRMGFAWDSLVAFVRLGTHPRVLERPLTPDEAWDYVDTWLGLDVSWSPVPTDRHQEVLGGLVRKYKLAGNVIADANLAALAIQHGLTICSADSHFARFSEIRWENPTVG